MPEAFFGAKFEPIGFGGFGRVSIRVIFGNEAGGGWGVIHGV
jgi:hypothetical protein